MAGRGEITHPWDTSCPHCMNAEAEMFKNGSQVQKPKTIPRPAPTKIRPMFAPDGKKWSPQNDAPSRD